MNIVDTLLTQYANSPVIVGLLEGLNEVIDPSADIQQFYDMVFNLSTAQGYGLDIWGRIVGVSRNVPYAVGDDPLFGFSEAEEYTPFNDAPFNGSGSGFSSYRMLDSQYRQVIIIKAYSNILYATAPNINKFLYYIFQKRAYYRVLGDMNGQYVFEFNPTSFERVIIFYLGVLPVPCGVSVEYKIISSSGTLGFNGSQLQPFNQGTFRK